MRRLGAGALAFRPRSHFRLDPPPCRDPLAASAINRVVINSMRFMLEAAGIRS